MARIGLLSFLGIRHQYQCWRGLYPVYVMMNSEGEIEKLEIAFEPIL
jgi:hypothetical protein